MKFCAENSKDIQKYFQGAFVKFPGMGGVYGDGSAAKDAGDIIHTVDHVTPNSIKGKRREGDEDVPYEFLLYSEDEAPPPEVEFILPRKGFFNADSHAYMLYRIPARQYKRGVCNDNTAIVKLTADGSFNEQPLDIKLLTAYVEKQAYRGFASHGLSSYAVSRRIAVSASGMVFIDRVRVGSVDTSEKTITLSQILFQHEIERALVEHGQYNFKVVVAQPNPNKKKVKKITDTWGIDSDFNIIDMQEVD